MRTLIINADDLGVNTQRTHGIFQCFEFGIVTSATLLPNAADSERAGKQAREKGLPVGLHLNLTEEYPLSKRDSIESLVEGNGMFLQGERMRKALDAGEVKKEHLEREIRAQIEWFFDTVGSPTHVDSHHHIHTHPVVAAALIPILERYGVRYVRIPLEEPLPPFGYIITEEQLEKTKHINVDATIAKDMYGAYGIATSDHFRGLTLSGNASLKNIRHIIGRLPEGITELMVHPGSACTFGTPFDLDPQRQTELRMLTDVSIAEELKERGIKLASYGDL
ncbi:ChbG/HpnK family deacetylase [Candidatus Peribacteria bacterium]|nr:ChbG/HpnK family deacetylase [Candidatus Peribacteria bacterium]